MDASSSNRAPFQLGFCVALASPTPPSDGTRSGNTSTKKVSGSFYKRPSAAIERGGGFYVPGLEGNKLPGIVGAVTGALLTVNWALTAEATHTPAALVSSTAASIGVLALILGGRPAVEEQTTVGTSNELESREMTQNTTPQDNPTALGGASSVGGSPLPCESPGVRAAEQRLQEVLDVAVELTGADTAVAMRWQGVDGVPTVAASSGIISASRRSAGEVITRVGEEDRGVYVSDLSSLPPGVDLPILLDSGARGSAVVEPVSEGIVAVIASVKADAFGPEARAWLGGWLRSPERGTDAIDA